MASAPSSLGRSANTAAREREYCIESALKEIESELAETVNSSVNLADKLKSYTPPPSPIAPGQPDSGDVMSRLQRIVSTVRHVNMELNRAHSAVSG